MRQDNITIAKIPGIFREVLRINKTEEENKNAPEYTVYNDGSALIDSTKTHLNYPLIPPHPALNPEKASTEDGKGLVEYYKSITGRYPRMHGEEKQLSKAVGVIITLPIDYIHKEHELTNDEYAELMKYLESGRKPDPENHKIKSIHEKLAHEEYSGYELESIKQFFSSALKAWQKNAGIRDQDMLYAVVHMDETTPHLHVCALPSVEKEVHNKKTGETEIRHTFSTDKFNNRRTHYFDTLHRNIIDLMREDGIDASGLLNGTTKEKEFNPNTLSHNERQEGVILAKYLRATNDAIKKARITLKSLGADKSMLEQEATECKRKIMALKKEYTLAREEAESLKKDKGFLAALKYNKPETIKVSPQMARKIKNSELEYEKLKKREADVTRREQNVDKIIKSKVKELMPKRIRKIEDEVIPRIKQTKRENNEKAKELEKREAENLAKEQELLQKEQELSIARQNLMTLINQGIREKLTKKILKMIEEYFNKILSLVNKSFIGHHQQALFDKVKELKLPEEFIVNGQDYGNKTISDALRKAEGIDIKQAIIDSGCCASDIDATDIYNVRKALSEGKTIAEAAMSVAATIQNSLDER